MPMDVSVEMAEQFQGNPMETGSEENMEVSQPAASPGPSLPEKRLYKSRSVLRPLGKKGWDHSILAALCITLWGVPVQKIKQAGILLCAYKGIFERRKCKEGQNVGMLWKLCLSAHLISFQVLQDAASALLLLIISHCSCPSVTSGYTPCCKEASRTGMCRVHRKSNQYFTHSLNYLVVCVLLFP